MPHHAFSGSEALTECSDASVQDEADRQLQGRVVDAVPTFPTDPQVPEALQPRQSALDHPVRGSQARSMGLSPAGDDRCDAQGADHAAVTVVIAAAVRVQPPRSEPGAPSAATDRGNRLEQGERLGDIVAVAAGAGHRERGFAPGRARSTGLGPVSGRPAGPSMGGVDGGPGEVRSVPAAQAGRQDGLEVLPDAGLVPVPRPTPAGHARAEAQFLRQSLPLDVGGQHERDALQSFAVVQPLAAWVIVTALDPRQERLDQPHRSSSISQGLGRDITHLLVRADPLKWTQDSADISFD